MRGRSVQIVIDFFDVLAVVPLRIRQAKETLLENRIPPVPERQRQAKVLSAIADPGDPIFTPAISPAPRMVMREIFPRRAVRTVVLAHRAPLPFGDIRSPAPPMFVARFLQTLSLCVDNTGG